MQIGLSHIITSETRRKLLYYLFHVQKKPESIREISRQSKVNINSTVKEITQLAKIQLLNTKIHGNTKIVWVNTDHPLYMPLYSCLFKSYGLGALLLKYFYKQAYIKFIIVTYFLLEHKPKDKYDFDILFVTSKQTDMQQIMQTMQDIEVHINKSLIFTALKMPEFVNRIKLFDTFVWKVFKHKHIFVKGNFYNIFSETNP